MIRTWRPPQRRWQVPRSWWTRWRNGAFLAGGFTLALGFLTPIYFWSYFVFVTLLSTLTPPLAGVVGGLYGLVRSIPAWRAASGPVFCGVVQPVRIRRALLRFRRITAVMSVATALIATVCMFATMGVGT